jgi:TIGR03009 family protein
VQGPPRQGVPAKPAVQQGAALPQRPPQAPFTLTPEQQAELTNLLRAWEQKSDAIKTMYCDFTRWDYDVLNGPWEPDPAKPGQQRLVPIESQGELKYTAPDKGLYRITKIKHYWPDPRAPEGRKLETRSVDDWFKQSESPGWQWRGEYWVCDGLSIWEYNFNEKQLVERKLPPELQGKAIADGPLPFLFSAKADKLTGRYFLRIATPPEVKGQIWLDALPRYQVDAANFKRATLILDSRTYLPFALKVVPPQQYRPDLKDESHFVLRFQNNVVNDPLRIFKADFSKPALPRGWTKVEDVPRPVPGATVQAPRPGVPQGPAPLKR